MRSYRIKNITENDDVEYVDSKNKITAHVKSHTSAKYTKLAQNITRIKELQKEVDLLVEETKKEARETIGELFSAEDEVKTRVVETVSFTIQLTKTPAPTNTVKYSKVLEELQDHLTPDLIKVLEDIKSKFTTVTQKAASLSMTAKESESVDGMMITEGIFDKLKELFTQFLANITKWCQRYDSKLDKLKAEVGM